MQEFIITDPQGNARVSFQNNGSGAAVVEQENSYYGFGLIMPNSPVTPLGTPNKKLYNGGSEWQNDFINLPDYYETPNRNYDAALGRFIGVDPMAESAESLTTYNYAGNNPVTSNDPSGDITQGEQEWLDWMSSDQSKSGNTASDWYDAHPIGSGTGLHDGGSGFSGNNDSGSTGNSGSNFTGDGSHWANDQLLIDARNGDPAAIQEYAFENGTSYVWNPNAYGDNPLRDDGKLIDGKYHVNLYYGALQLAANQGGWNNNYREFQAIVAGEARNFDDATGIGSVILNRMAVKGVTFDNDNWLYAISIHHKGKTVAQDIYSQYNAYGGAIYNQVMNMSADALAQSGYAMRVAGANEAFDGYMEGFDYSNGAYIWNASSQQYSSHPGFNFNMVTQGVYTITGTLGGTTFMRYTNESKTWP